MGSVLVREEEENEECRTRKFMIEGGLVLRRGKRV